MFSNIYIVCIYCQISQFNIDVIVYHIQQSYSFIFKYWLSSMAILYRKAQF